MTTTDDTITDLKTRKTIQGLSTTTVTTNTTASPTVVTANTTSVNGGMVTLPDSDISESKIYRLDADIPAAAALADTILFTIDNAAVAAPFYYVHVSSSADKVEFKLVNATLTAGNVADGAEIPLNEVVSSADTPLPANLELRVAADAPAPDSETEGAGGFDAGDVIILDILSFGEATDEDGDKYVENNAIYRHLVTEGDTGGVFEGTLEYVMLNQINIADDDTYDNIVTESDELVMIIDDEYSGNDLQISYSGETAHVEVLTSGGTVSLDADSYSTNGSVSVTLIDQDLNVADGDVESYTLNQDGSVFKADSTAKLLVFEIDDTVWDNRCGADPALGLPADFTLEESEDEPGTFTASFDIPTDYCSKLTDDAGTSIVAPVTGKSLQVTYEDFRDDTGIATTWSDSATIQAVTGTVTIDRNVYPVPADDKNVVVHIEINDPDFNANSDVLDKIPIGQVTVEITAISSPTPEDNKRGCVWRRDPS